MDTSDHVTKSDPKRIFEKCLQKMIFPPKINQDQDRVAKNDFDLQNDFYEDEFMEKN
jgi:hypothetical protein